MISAAEEIMAKGFKLFEGPVPEPIPGVGCRFACWSWLHPPLCGRTRVTQAQPAVWPAKEGQGWGHSSGSHRTIL